MISDSGGVFVLSVNGQSSASKDLLLPQFRALRIQLLFCKSCRASVDSLRHESPSITERRGAIDSSFKTTRCSLKIAPSQIPSCSARRASASARRHHRAYPIIENIVVCRLEVGGRLNVLEHFLRWNNGILKLTDAMASVHIPRVRGNRGKTQVQIDRENFEKNQVCCCSVVSACGVALPLALASPGPGCIRHDFKGRSHAHYLTGMCQDDLVNKPFCCATLQYTTFGILSNGVRPNLTQSQSIVTLS